MLTRSVRFMCSCMPDAKRRVRAREVGRIREVCSFAHRRCTIYRVRLVRFLRLGADAHWRPTALVIAPAICNAICSATSKRLRRAAGSQRRSGLDRLISLSFDS